MGARYSGFGWGGLGTWGGLGIIGLILNLVFFAGFLTVLGVGTVWVMRQVRRRPSDPAGRPDPLDIVRQRLAAGEITATEFEEIRERLGS